MASRAAKDRRSSDEAFNEAVFLCRDHLNDQPNLAYAYFYWGLFCEGQRRTRAAFDKSMPIAKKLNNHCLQFLLLAFKCTRIAACEVSELSPVFDIARMFQTFNLKHMFVCFVYFSVSKLRFYHEPLINLLKEAIECSKSLGYRAVTRLFYMEAARRLGEAGSKKLARTFAACIHEYRLLCRDLL